MANNRNQSLAWLREQRNICIQERITDYENPIRGIYGIFCGKDKKCAYIGKSINIYSRMFKSDGHVTKMMLGDHGIEAIRNAVLLKESISIEVLEDVEYVFDNYYKDMQRLASRENYYIDQYQAVDQCLEQLPEGTTMTLCDWKKLKNGDS